MSTPTNKKTPKSATPPRFYASADQYLSSALQATSKEAITPTKKGLHDVPNHSHTSHSTRKSSASPQRKYRQMPLTMSIDDSTSIDGNKHWMEVDDTGSDDSERLAQYEHDSLVKVVTRLRDGNYVSQATPQIVPSYTTYSSPNVTYSHSPTSNSIVPLNNFNQNQTNDLHTVPNKGFHDGLPLSNNHQTNSNTYNHHTNGKTYNSTELQSTFSTTPKSRTIPDYHSTMNEDSVLESSRRQMETEIAESKRVLQQQLDIQRLYARSPQKTDHNDAKLVLSSTTPEPTSPLDNDAYAQVQALEEKLRASSVQVQELTAKLTSQREAYTQTVEELRETHARSLVELRETHAQDQMALDRQLRELRSEHHCVALKQEEMRRETEQRIESIMHEAQERERKLERQLIALKKEAEERDIVVCDLTRLREQASAYRAEADEARARQGDLEKARAQLAEDRLRLSEERKQIDEERKRVEEQRRQYEKAGTEGLRVLNDANEKIIALEEQKWKLEDQRTELLAFWERERKSFEHQRGKLEQEVTKHKEEAQREVTIREKAEGLHQAQLDDINRDKHAIHAENIRIQELLQVTGREADVLRNRLSETEQSVLKLDSLRSQAANTHSMEREQWSKDRLEWEKEKESLSEATLAAQKESQRLEVELCENRRKFDSVKKLLG